MNESLFATECSPLDAAYRVGAYCPAQPYEWPVRWCGATVQHLSRLPDPPPAFAWAFTGETERGTLRRALRMAEQLGELYADSLLRTGWHRVEAGERGSVAEGVIGIFRGGDVFTEHNAVFHTSGSLQLLAFRSMKRAAWVVWSERGLVRVDMDRTTAHPGQWRYLPPQPWEAP